MASESTKLTRPTWAEISLGALRRNLERVQALAQPRRVMAVVKADGYGHGALAVARTLAEAGADWFGVATMEEAIELRQAGHTQPVLLLGSLHLGDPAHLVAHRLTPAVSSVSQLEALAECAERFGQEIEFHLKVDTGLGRLGVLPDQVEPFLTHYRALRGVKLTGVFTHLASAEDLSDDQTDVQQQRFKATVDRLRAAGYRPDWVHMSNSSALLTGRASSENLVRIGALLYGFHLPVISAAGSPASPGAEFEPVLSFKTRVVYLKDVPPRSPLGYGGTFRTARPSRIATIPVGYADGLSRALSNRGRALVRGQAASIVGNISMDLTLLDVTDIPAARVGDEVVLIGRSGQETISALEVAQLAGTIPYEVLCQIGKRVPRVYVD